jgi:NAD(P)H-dependent FMN reductase
MRLTISWKFVPLIAVLLILGSIGGLWLSRIADSPSGTVLTAGILIGVLVSAALIVRGQNNILVAVMVMGAMGIFGLLWSLQAALLGWTAVVAAAISMAWYIFWDLWITGAVNAETTSELIALGGHGTAGRALIVHHPSKRGFVRRLVGAYADGMISNDWHVDLTTASWASTGDVSSYDLIVLAAPVYNWRAAKPLLTHVGRMTGMNGKSTVIVLAGGGMTDRALADLRDRVVSKGATTIDALEIWTERPNTPRYGTSDPDEIMRRAGAHLGAARSSSQHLDDMLSDALEQTFPASDPVSLHFDRPEVAPRSISTPSINNPTETTGKGRKVA